MVIPVHTHKPTKYLLVRPSYKNGQSSRSRYKSWNSKIRIIWPDLVWSDLIRFNSIQLDLFAISADFGTSLNMHELAVRMRWRTGKSKQSWPHESISSFEGRWYKKQSHEKSNALRHCPPFEASVQGMIVRWGYCVRQAENRSHKMTWQGKARQSKATSQQGCVRVCALYAYFTDRTDLSTGSSTV